MTSRPQGGFSLLEAIVALTIMATTLLALYGWLSSSALALGRVKANAALLEDKRSALAVIETLNPTEDPEGERRLGDLRIRWTARPVTETRMAITRANLPSAFDVTLYDVEVGVQRDRGSEATFQVRRAGWRLARLPEAEE